MARILGVLALVVIGGCRATTGQVQMASSGHLGCEPDAIQVADYKLGLRTSSWTATCRGKKYYCSGSDTLKGVSCSTAK